MQRHCTVAETPRSQKKNINPFKSQGIECARHRMRKKMEKERNVRTYRENCHNEFNSTLTIIVKFPIFFTV